MSKLSKLLDSGLGKILLPLGDSYLKRQSADYRKAAPYIELITDVRQATKSAPVADALAGTIYGAQNQNTGATMPEQITAAITPMKTGTATSTFKVSTLAVIVTPLIPILLKVAENLIGVLPPGSIWAAVAPGVLAVCYTVFRYLSTSNERNANAELANAQAAAIIAQATVKSTPAPRSARSTDAPEPLTATIGDPIPTGDDLGVDTSDEITAAEITPELEAG